MSQFRNSSISMMKLRKMGFGVWVFIFWDKKGKKQQQPFICELAASSSCVLEKAKRVFSWSKYEGVYRVYDSIDDEERNADDDLVSHVYFSVRSLTTNETVNIQMYNVREDTDLYNELVGEKPVKVVQQRRIYE